GIRASRLLIELAQGGNVDSAGARVMADRVARIVIDVVLAVDDVRSASMHVERAIRLQLDKGRMRPTSSIGLRQSHALQPVDRFRNAREEFSVPRQLVERDEVTDVALG